ncbi:MAG: hypothetical protein MUC63_00720, partial [Planctomycetes bacterium]|nr:hypothetical protein [Planctomycetota bacterium]
GSGCAVLAVAAAAALGTPEGSAQDPEPPPAYAVVASRATRADPEWSQVVDAAARQHAARVFVWESGVEEVREGLSDFEPRYACFVCRPEEAGRDFVAKVHRLTRALDEDPYGDCVWAVLTGYEAADALRIVRRCAPLKLRRGLAATAGGWLANFPEGIGYSEGRADERWVKTPDDPAVKTDKERPQDTIALFVQELNGGKVDAMWTSGHATERDWQAGYSYPNGQFRHAGGRLLGLDLSGKAHPVDSPNPKLYYAPGNCLIGHVDRRDCMATAWIHSGGADMMCGYTVPTWYGFMGWGVSSYFFQYGPSTPFPHAFFFNNQAIVFGLEEKLPEVAGDPRALQGHLHDLDVVALFGDPAWDVRPDMRPDAHPLTSGFAFVQVGSAKRVDFQVEALKDFQADALRPAARFLPFRIEPVKPDAIERKEPFRKDGSEAPRIARVAVTDDLVLMQIAGPVKAGDRFSVSFPVLPAAPRAEAKARAVADSLKALARARKALAIEAGPEGLEMLGKKYSPDAFAGLCGRLEAMGKKAAAPGLAAELAWFGPRAEAPADAVRRLLAAVGADPAKGLAVRCPLEESAFPGAREAAMPVPAGFEAAAARVSGSPAGREKALLLAGGARACALSLAGAGRVLWDSSMEAPASPALLADLDGDGACEAFFCAKDGASLRMTVLDGKTGAPGAWKPALLRGAEDTGGGPSAVLSPGQGKPPLWLATVNTGFGRAPRGVWAFDPATGEQAWAFPIGPSAGEPRVADLDGDGAEEVVFGSYAPNNGASAGGTDDRHSYAFAVSASGRSLWTLATGDYFTGCRVEIPEGLPGRVLVATHAAHTHREDGGAVGLVDGKTGKVLKALDIGKSVAQLLPGPGGRILAVDRDGFARVLDGDLKPLVEKPLAEAVRGLAKGGSATALGWTDLDGDREPELLLRATGEKGAFLAAVRPDLKAPLWTRAVPPETVVVPIDAEGDGRTELLLLGKGTATVLRVGKE